jgi:hypothetical protein
MMNVNNQACHPERSEGSQAVAHDSAGMEILRCAQDDRERRLASHLVLQGAIVWQ